MDDQSDDETAPMGAPMSLSQSDDETAESAWGVAKKTFEEFDASMDEDNLPIIVFSDDARDQMVWKYGGRVSAGKVVTPSGKPDLIAKDAIVMSPAYLGFTVEPEEPRYLHFQGVGIVFERPWTGKFMQPSIDTMLLCHAIGMVMAEKDLAFKRLIDVGTGSGMLGKFAAVYAPGEGELSVTLSDIDPAAAEYCRSPGFGARKTSANGRPLSWNYSTGDAAKLLEDDPNFDLIVSNPPYIPSREEAQDEEGLMKPTNFWEGCGLLVRMLELMIEGKHPENAHLIIGITSLTLKSRRVRRLLDEAPSKGVRVRKLVEREIAWKAWYAGRGSGPSYLLASVEEERSQQQIGDNQFFVGATNSGESRTGGERDRLYGYHWHVAYMLDISRTSSDEGL